MSEIQFYCCITNINVNKNNLLHWSKLLSKNQTLNIALTKFINKYGANNINQYYDIISNAIVNGNINDKIINFNTQTNININNDLTKEQHRLKELITNSKETIDGYIIRMLISDDQTNAINLYIKFKEFMNEDKKDVEYIEDFILKNCMFGIFDNNNLAGFVIVDFKRTFQLEEHSKIDTFYIQEMYIDDKYQKYGLGTKLFKYAIAKCPENIKHITLMTRYENLAMIKIAETNGFIKQLKPSGDPYNQLLMLKNLQ